MGINYDCKISNLIEIQIHYMQRFWIHHYNVFLFVFQFTIPKDATGDFDDNAFALKIMAIDYNATNTLRSR